MSFFCTEGGNRTHTMLPSLDFESSASTNSATSARYILQNVSVLFVFLSGALDQRACPDLAGSTNSACPNKFLIWAGHFGKSFFHIAIWLFAVNLSLNSFTNDQINQ